MATGSVYVSCVTSTKTANGKNSLINTGKNADGKILTSLIYEKITSIMVVDEKDHSRRIELAEGEWDYHTDTSEISILKSIPYPDYFISVRGTAQVPYTVILTDLAESQSLLVILQGRLAIDGFDYRLDETMHRLTFRPDIELTDTEWNIQYRTQTGGSSIGEWKPDNIDTMSYLEAEHRKRYLDGWYDRQKGFWFFDDASSPMDKPELVFRPATPEELRILKATPTPVMKFRIKGTARSLSREAGYRIFFPDSISIDDGSTNYAIWARTLEEYADNGNLVRTVHIMYEQKVEKKQDERAFLELTISPIENEIAVQEESAISAECIISKETVTIGRPVSRVRQWVQQTSNPEMKPEVVAYTTWKWNTPTATYSISGNTDQETVIEKVIAEIAMD